MSESLCEDWDAFDFFFQRKIYGYGLIALGATTRDYGYGNLGMYITNAIMMDLDKRSLT